jgi:hypothetical protein
MKVQRAGHRHGWEYAWQAYGKRKLTIALAHGERWFSVHYEFATSLKTDST